MYSIKCLFRDRLSFSIIIGQFISRYINGTYSFKCILFKFYQCVVVFLHRFIYNRRLFFCKILAGICSDTACRNLHFRIVSVIYVRILADSASDSINRSLTARHSSRSSLVNVAPPTVKFPLSSDKSGISFLKNASSE